MASASVTTLPNGGGPKTTTTTIAIGTAYEEIRAYVNDKNGAYVWGTKLSGADIQVQNEPPIAEVYRSGKTLVYVSVENNAVPKGQLERIKNRQGILHVYKLFSPDAGQATRYTIPADEDGTSDNATKNPKRARPGDTEDDEMTFEKYKNAVKRLRAELEAHGAAAANVEESNDREEYRELVEQSRHLKNSLVSFLQQAREFQSRMTGKVREKIKKNAENLVALGTKLGIITDDIDALTGIDQDAERVELEIKDMSRQFEDVLSKLLRE